MEHGRIWQRGASKGRKGSKNARMMFQDPADMGDDNKYDAALQKSLIAETLQGARAHVGGKASLNEPSRPFTPGDLPRHLFQGNDYSNRPGSSYKMGNVIGQDIHEFASITSGTPAKTQAETESLKSMRSSLGTSEDVLSIMDRHQPQIRGAGGLPPTKPKMRAAVAGQLLPPLQFKQKKERILKDSKEDTPQILAMSSPTSAGTPSTPAGEKKTLKQPNQLSGQQHDIKDFQDLIGDAKNKKKYDEATEQSKKDFEQIRNQISHAPSTIQKNKGKAMAAIEDFEDEDELEDQMADTLFKEADTLGVFANVGVDYAAAMNKIESEISKSKEKQAQDKPGDSNQIDSTTGIKKEKEMKDGEDHIDNENDELYDQVLDTTNDNKNLGSYETEYNEVISIMSKICRHVVWNANPVNQDRKIKINEDEIAELAPRIWSLSAEYEGQTDEIKRNCFLQTLLKGSFSLLGIKSPTCALKVSGCNIQLFFKIFERIIKQYKLAKTKAKKDVDNTDDLELIKSISADLDFTKIFNYLYETVRGLLIYAKEGDFDKLFIEENLIPQLANIIIKCYHEHSDLIMKLTCKVVNKNVITDDDKMYDLINYVIGTIKCFTQTNKEVQRNTVQNQMIAVLSKALQTTFIFGNNPNKQSQILVQISGTLRNLANVEDSYGLLLHCKILPKLCEIYGDIRFRDHKELILNVSRLLSKVSIDYTCAEQMVQTKNTSVFLGCMEHYKENSAVFIRIAFVLGNLTTHYEMARRELCQTNKCFTKCINLALFYLDKDLQGLNQVRDIPKDAKTKKYEEFSITNIEDATTKIVKLIANLSTEEIYAQKELNNEQQSVQQFVSTLVKAIDKRTIDTNEEFILNAISCITNVLFYDVPNKELLTNDIRIDIFNSIKLYILATQNEEIQIETVRVLSNLSRHSKLCDEFVSDSTFLEALTVVLDHTLRDLVFYSVGIIINITLHEDSRQKILEKDIVVPKLIEVLKDSNIEDIDLSKVAAKALHNMTQVKPEIKPKINDYWTNESIEKLDGVLQSLGDELDSIMDVASGDELVEIQSLRKLINDLNNDMPTTLICCPVGCGRKFLTQDLCDDHVKRRHPEMWKMD